MRLDAQEDLSSIVQLSAVPAERGQQHDPQRETPNVPNGLF